MNTAAQQTRGFVNPQRTSVEFDIEPMNYDMTGNKFLVIFNHTNFEINSYYREPLDDRQGTEADVAKLKNVFGDLGFKVIVFTDLKHDEILMRTAEISIQNHERTACLAIVILTHGSESGKLCAKDKPYFLKDITMRFENGDKGLLGKPKLFFIQACRGRRVDSGRRVEYDGDEEIGLVIPKHLDFFYLYSTVEDYASWIEDDGSWLIQDLCKVVGRHYHEFDLGNLAMLTIREIAYTRQSHVPEVEEHHKKKQTPEVRHTLTRRVFFTTADNVNGQSQIFN